MEGNVTEYLNFVDGVVLEHGQNVDFLWCTHERKYALMVCWASMEGVSC